MKEGEHRLGHAGQWLCLGVFLTVWVVDSFLLHWSTLLGRHVPLVFRLALAGMAVVAASWLFRSGHVVVAHDHPSDAVVRSGAFRHVRHPLYLASLLIYLGLTVSTVSLASLAVLAGVFAFYDYIAGYEEDLLQARFGEAYRAYRNNTGKWVPRVGGGA